MESAGLSIALRVFQGLSLCQSTASVAPGQILTFAVLIGGGGIQIPSGVCQPYLEWHPGRGDECGGKAAVKMQSGAIASLS